MSTKPPALSADEAKRKILFILERGIVEPTWHCKEETMPRRGVEMTDLLHVLKTGVIVRDPEWDDDHDNWKYRVEGKVRRQSRGAFISTLRAGWIMCTS